MFCVISHRRPGQSGNESEARLIPMKDGTIGFEAPYDNRLVLELKTQIPYRDRRWDPDQKLWFVAPQYAELLADLAERFDMGRPEVPQVKAQATTSFTERWV